MTTFATRVGPPSRVDARRDRFGRPYLPDPVTGSDKTWQRVTTLAGMIDDTYKLNQYTCRKTALGIATNDRLRLAVATTDPEDSKTLNDLVERAQEHAGSKDGADLGTAAHWVRQVRVAHPDAPVESYCPPELREWLAVYDRIVAEYGLVFDSRWQERLGVCPEVGCAGTWDDLVTFAGDGDPNHDQPSWSLADVKSGLWDFEYGQGKDATQMAIYSRMTALWRTDGQGYEAVPEVDQTHGYVIHIPIKDLSAADVYAVDLVEGWERAQLAVQVRAKRAVKKGIFQSLRRADGVELVTVEPGVRELGDDQPATGRAKRRTRAQIEHDKCSTCKMDIGRGKPHAVGCTGAAPCESDVTAVVDGAAPAHPVGPRPATVDELITAEANLRAVDNHDAADEVADILARKTAAELYPSLVTPDASISGPDAGTTGATSDVRAYLLGQSDTLSDGTQLGVRPAGFDPNEVCDAASQSSPSHTSFGPDTLPATGIIPGASAFGDAVAAELSAQPARCPFAGMEPCISGCPSMAERACVDGEPDRAVEPGAFAGDATVHPARVNRANGLLGSNQAFCAECIDVAGEEDPAPWCDCRPDEQCVGPCRRRAHEPWHCPNNPANRGEPMGCESPRTDHGDGGRRLYPTGRFCDRHAPVSGLSSVAPAEHPLDATLGADARTLLVGVLGATPIDERSGAARDAALTALHNGTSAYDELAAARERAVELGGTMGEQVAEYDELIHELDKVTTVAEVMTLYGLWSNHWTPQVDEYAILRLIEVAPDRAALDALWTTFTASWSDALTEAGMARLDVLDGAF